MNVYAVMVAVCNEYGITIEALKSKSRLSPLPDARKMISYICREENQTKVARFIRLDRSTVSTHIGVVADHIQIYSDVQRHFDNIMQQLEQNKIINNNLNEMTIKLTMPQLEGLHQLITVALNSYSPENMAEKLLFEVVDKINDRLRLKIKRKQFESKTGSSVTLNSVEARAFYCWYSQVAALFESESCIYERIIATNVVGQIDKVYA